MKHISVKLRITIWLTMLTMLLSGLLLVFMVSVSSSVVSRTSEEQLTQTVRSNLDHVSMVNGNLSLGEEFRYYRNGVSTLVYSQNNILLAGQIPVSFTAEEPFQNGVIRKIPVEDDQYLILDVWMPLDWENGLWVRGLLEVPENNQIVRNLLMVALIALPTFIILAAVGGYMILRRAFRPLDSITATAAAINEARDLSRRIGLPKGKDEFSRLAETFDLLFERLEKSFEAEKQFTSDASHELRTPVSIIKGACEYGQKYDETEEEHQETLAMIYRQTEKMSRLISQLLSMTRFDQGTERAHFEIMDLGVLAKDFCEEQGDGQTRLIPEINTGVMVNGDSALLGRLLQNLVDNAFKYGKEDGHVWVSVERQGQEALLRVRDDGIGIPAEQQEKIWQRFYQVDSSRSGESGSGLGLAMVKQIAELHSGCMTLESVPDVGSVFTLHLPLAETVIIES